MASVTTAINERFQPLLLSLDVAMKGARHDVIECFEFAKTTLKTVDFTKAVETYFQVTELPLAILRTATKAANGTFKPRVLEIACTKLISSNNVVKTELTDVQQVFVTYFNEASNEAKKTLCDKFITDTRTEQAVNHALTREDILNVFRLKINPETNLIEKSDFTLALIGKTTEKLIESAKKFKHHTSEERKAHNAKVPCRYGDKCSNSNCQFKHNAQNA